MKTFSRLLLTLTLLGPQAQAQQLDLFKNGNSNPGLDKELAEVLGLNPNGPVFSHKGGNGGDSIGDQFSLIAKNTATIWESICRKDERISGFLGDIEAKKKYCASLPKFKAMLTSGKDFVTVFSREEVAAKDGVPRDAINIKLSSGKRLIVVGENSWEDMGDDNYGGAERKVKLVLHEYFSLLGLESSDVYDASNEFFYEIHEAGYRIKSLTDPQPLPESCSVSIADDKSLSGNRLREIGTKLTQNGFKVVPYGRASRYTLVTKTSCSSFWGKSCTAYVDLKDNAKVRFNGIFNKFTSKIGLNRDKATDGALEEGFKLFPSCK